MRQHGLLSAFQSGFIPGDSTTNQLAHVYHIMCEALDKKKEVRVVFCDISKAFDRVWHEGLLYKLEAIGITGSLLLWFQSYLSNRKQKVVIGNDSSCTGQIKAGVPQGSVLGPLLFLVFINDITENINSKIRLFAHDTTLFIDFDDESEAVDLINKDLDAISKWADRWLVNFCPSKSETLLVSLRKRNEPIAPVYFGNTVTSHKHLGMIFTRNLSWDNQVDDIAIKACKRVDILAHLKYRLDRNSLEIIYKSFIRPKLEYGDIIMSNMTDEQSQLIEHVNKGVGCIISGAIRGTSSSVLFEELSWVSMETRRKHHRMYAFHKIVFDLSPPYLRDCIPSYVRDISSYRIFGMQTHYEQSHAGLTYFINPFLLWRFVSGTCFHLNWKQFRITKNLR